MYFCVYFSVIKNNAAPRMQGIAAGTICTVQDTYSMYICSLPIPINGGDGEKSFFADVKRRKGRRRKGKVEPTVA
jgi:hypothetical protein